MNYDAIIIGAGLGGLTTGMVYQTDGNGNGPLAQLGILMIKQ